MLIIRVTDGADALVGGPGADSLWGAGGRDVMTGNGGADHFVLFGQAEATRWSTLPNLVQVTDFRPTEGDRIQLEFSFAGANGAFAGNLAPVAELATGFAVPATPEAPVRWFFWVPDSAGGGGWLIADFLDVEERTIVDPDFVARIDFADGTPVDSFDPA